MQGVDRERQRQMDRWTETEKQRVSPTEQKRDREGGRQREEGKGAGHTQTPAGGDRSEHQGHVRLKQHRGSPQHPGAAPGCGPGPCSAPEPLSPRSCGLGHLASLDSPRSRLRPEPHCGALESELSPLACLFRALSPPRLTHICPPRTHILARAAQSGGTGRAACGPLRWHFPGRHTVAASQKA